MLRIVFDMFGFLFCFLFICCFCCLCVWPFICVCFVVVCFACTGWLGRCVKLEFVSFGCCLRCFDWLVGFRFCWFVCFSLVCGYSVLVFLCLVFSLCLLCNFNSGGVYFLLIVFVAWLLVVLFCGI